MAIPMC